MAWIVTHRPTKNSHTHELPPSETEVVGTIVECLDCGARYELCWGGQLGFEKVWVMKGRGKYVWTDQGVRT